MQTHFVFYGNSTLSLGSGHIMRLFALAQWVQKSGYKATFIYKNCLEYQIKKIQQAGFAIKQLPQHLTAEHIMQLDPTHIVIDDYFLSTEEWHVLEHLPIVTVAFDDALNENPLPVDVVINTSSTASVSIYKKRAPQAELCLGDAYTLLRREFVERAEQLPEYQNRKKILITMGGTDVQGLTLPLCKQLLTENPKLLIDVLIGSASQAKPLQEIAQEFSNLTLHINSAHVAEVMADAGLAISAAGSTLYELASMRIPTFALICADNQAAVLESKYNGSWYEAFDFRNFKNEPYAQGKLNALCATVNDLYADYQKRFNMHQLAAQAVNIKGGQLILNKIMHSTSK